MIKKRLMSNDRFDIQSDIMETMAKDLAKSIDFDVLASILVSSCNWHVVEINRTSVETVKWCSQYSKGKWKYHGRKFLFENEKDSNWFALRWL